MKIWTDTLPYNLEDKNNALAFTEGTLFFDIETTGFSPAYTDLYLIGCACRRESSLILTQFFAESKDDESAVLEAFLKFLEPFSTIVTFNGSGFDIPYLTFKCEKYHLPASFASKNGIDFYKLAASMRSVLNLPNYKQKTIESFLNIAREDIYSGGELIEFYKKYLIQPDEQALFLLKQHNYEDVLGLTALLPLGNFQNLFQGGFTVTDLESNLYQDMNGVSQKELIFTLQNTYPLPTRISCHYGDFHFTGSGSTSRLSVHLFDGELKYFLEHPEEYYYLPMEDRAVHKSVASYVDKAYRKKATKATCYLRKEAIFVPQCKSLFTPEFLMDYKDTSSYFELTKDFLDSDTQLYQYVSHVLQFLFSHKN